MIPPNAQPLTPAGGSSELLRAAPPSLKAAALAWGLDHLAPGFAALRRVWPIAGFGSRIFVTRYDDVREVLAVDRDFEVIYAQKLEVLTGKPPFVLGMTDSAEVLAARETLQRVMPPADIARLAARATDLSAARLERSGGELDVVEHVRAVTSEVFSAYLGIGTRAGLDLQLITMRLFQFLLADPLGDADLSDEAIRLSKDLRDHVDGLIRDRRGGAPVDDVLGRCVTPQGEGPSGVTEGETRTILIGLTVGGVPQLVLAAAHSLDQLLSRRDALEMAQAAARADADEALEGCIFEALRFNPIAPLIARRCVRDHVLAVGRGRSRLIREGTVVQAAVASAMRDPRRLSDPERFDPTRSAAAYLQFGQGVHTCFGKALNQSILPAVLKPLLAKPGLERAPGRRGRLSKRGFLADQLHVQYRET